MRKPFFLMALMVIGAVAFVGCDSNDDGDEADDVLGLWLAESFPEDDETGAVTTAYLDIGSDEIVAYILFDISEVPEFEPCYFVQAADVVSRVGDRWTIEDVDGERYTTTIRRDGDELLLTEEGEGEVTIRFERSDVDTDTLTPVCEE